MKFCNKTNFSQKCSITKIKKQSEALATDGYRVIAIANGKIPLKKQYGIKDIKNLSFLGQVGFIDPVRKEAISSIRKWSQSRQNHGTRIQAQERDRFVERN